MIDTTSITERLDEIKGLEHDLKTNTQEQFSIHREAGNYLYSGWEQRKVDKLQGDAESLKDQKAMLTSSIRAEIERQLTEEAEAEAHRYLALASELTACYVELMALDHAICSGIRGAFLNPAWRTSALAKLPSDGKLRALKGVGRPTSSGTGIRHILDGSHVMADIRARAEEIRETVNQAIGMRVMR